MKQEHYDKLKIEPIEYIEANGLTFSEGNVVKYISRHRSKNGKEDVLKAIDYCNRILDVDYGHKIIDEPEEEGGYTVYDAIQFASFFRNANDAFQAIKNSKLIDELVCGASVDCRGGAWEVLMLDFYDGQGFDIPYLK